MNAEAQQVVELVNQWAAFAATQPSGTLTDFCLHYLTEQSGLLRSEQHHHPVTDEADEQWVESLTGKNAGTFVAIRPEARLGALVGRLSKYAYFYSKKAMQPLDFKSIEDPVYLIVLAQMGTPKKSELIYEMMSEFPSGIDIIKRLISMGLAEEFPDEHDRRSKRLRITPKGLDVMWRCFPEMNKVADIAYGSLTPGEKALLVHILDKLDRYHAERFKESRHADIDEVYARLRAEKPA